MKYLQRIKRKAFAPKTQVTRFYEAGFSGLDAFREEAEECMELVNNAPEFDDGLLVGDAYWAWLKITASNRAYVKPMDKFSSESEAAEWGFKPVTMVKVYKIRG